MSGPHSVFAYADTPFNDLTVATAATRPEAGSSLPRGIARAPWRERFQVKLASLDEVVRRALETADKGETAADLRRCCRQSRLRLARQRDAAHAPGIAARWSAQSDRQGGNEFSHPFAATELVEAVRLAPALRQRGIANTAIDLGPSAARLGQHHSCSGLQPHSNATIRSFSKHMA